MGVGSSHLLAAWTGVGDGGGGSQEIESSLFCPSRLPNISPPVEDLWL